MATITGKDLNIQWIYSGGTVVLSGDYTQFTDTPSVELLDESAGADEVRTYVARLKDRTMSFSARHQSGGTALLAALDEGTSGTIIWSPEGTVAGKAKNTIAAISQGASINIPYSNLVEISCTFQGNGALTRATN
jgi:hypothetical protein